MKKVCSTGSPEEARAIQEENGVAEDLRGPWYHGSGNRRLSVLDNRHAKFTWLTRSPSGGIAWGPSVLTVFVISSLDETHLTDAGAGDDGGTNPSDPTRKLPKWWLKVNTAEIDKLMVVQRTDKDAMSSSDLEATMQDVFLVNLQRAMARIEGNQ